MKYCICLILNNNFIKGGITTIYSFLKHNPWFDGDVVILSDDNVCILNEQYHYLFTAVYAKTIFIKCNFGNYQNMINSFKYHIQKRFIPVFYRLEIFNLTQYEKILCLDADLLIIKNIKSLWDYDAPLITIPSLNTTSNRIIKKRTNETFNAGVMLVNKPYISKEIFNEIFDFGEHFPFKKSGKWCGAYPEQDILNYFFYKKDVVLFPYLYNDRRTLGDDITTPYIIHFINQKPWLNNNDKNVKTLLWEHEYQECLKHKIKKNTSQ